MRVLVLHAHPVAESFNAALHRAAVETLRRAGHEVDDRDLYAESYDPVMSRDERIVHNRAGENTTAIARDVERLKAAEALVFVYPTWWLGMPAMLKGFIDRVFVPGVAFHLTGGLIAPGLTNIRKIAVITTYGGPWWYINLWLLRADRYLIARNIRRLCSPDCGIEWHALYKLDTAPEPARRAFLARVEAAMAKF